MTTHYKVSDESGFTRCRLTIKFPEIEIHALPKGSSALFFDKETISQSFPLVQIEDYEKRNCNHGCYNGERAISPRPATCFFTSS